MAGAGRLRTCQLSAWGGRRDGQAARQPAHRASGRQRRPAERGLGRRQRPMAGTGRLRSCQLPAWAVTCLRNVAEIQVSDRAVLRHLGSPVGLENLGQGVSGCLFYAWVAWRLKSLRHLRGEFMVSIAPLLAADRGSMVSVLDGFHLWWRASVQVG